MKVLFYIFNNPDLLNPVLKELSVADIKGGTIFDCDGMGRQLAKMNEDDFSFNFGSLRTLLKPDVKNTKALMLILTEEKIPSVISIIESVVGNLDNSETGILFSFGLDITKGVKL